MNSGSRRKIKYKLLVLLVSLHLETLEMHICECIINAQEYSEKYAQVMKLTCSVYAQVEVTIRAGGILFIDVTCFVVGD